MANPNPQVKKHLDKNGVNPNQLPESVIAALNSCTPEELQAMDKVGDSLEKANVQPNLRISAMH